MEVDGVVVTESDRTTLIDTDADAVPDFDVFCSR